MSRKTCLAVYGPDVFEHRSLRTPIRDRTTCRRHAALKQCEKPSSLNADRFSHLSGGANRGWAPSHPQWRRKNDKAETSVGWTDRCSHVRNSRHGAPTPCNFAIDSAANTDPGLVAAPGVSYIAGQTCNPAPRVGAFATAPWDNAPPCEPVYDAGILIPAVDTKRQRWARRYQCAFAHPKPEHHALMRQQPALALEAAAIFDQRTAGADQAMTGQDDAERIGAIGMADRAHRPWRIRASPPARRSSWWCPLESSAARSRPCAGTAYRRRAMESS